MEDSFETIANVQSLKIVLRIEKFPKFIAHNNNIKVLINIFRNEKNSFRNERNSFRNDRNSFRKKKIVLEMKGIVLEMKKIVLEI